MSFPLNGACSCPAWCKASDGGPFLGQPPDVSLWLPAAGTVQLSPAMASQVHQNYHKACEAAVNDVVALELRASYLYLALASAVSSPGAQAPAGRGVARESTGSQGHCPNLPREEPLPPVA